jgi:uncharacterized membrane protein YqjE
MSTAHEEKPQDTRQSKGPLRQFVAGLLTGAWLRVELLLLELRQEERRLVTVVIAAAAAALFGFMALLSANFLIIVLFWDRHRVLVAVVLGIVYLVLAVASALIVRQKLKAGRCRFAATLEQLRKDRKNLGGEDS